MRPSSARLPVEPSPGCGLCPRLVAFRAENARAEPHWHNAPVPAFGPIEARVLIVGLAPGRRGANATGRPFTGDWAGELLYPTLLKFGFARGKYGARADDGLTLADARITNAVRCVPPANKPTGAEATACGDFLVREIAAMGQLACIVTLGNVAHASALKALGIRRKDAPFGHGTEFRAADGRHVIASYHCSRLNTNTGRLTTQMFERIFARAREIADGAQP
jgi:uracil-DNA glycosylase family 4